MAAGSFAKAAAMTVLSDLVFNGSPPLILRPTPPSFSPNSMAVRVSSTSSPPQPNTSALSLLYEACGRMVNPVYGSVGLLCSGDWDKCQAAVDAVLTGSMIVEPDAPLSNTNLSLKCCDIRHVCNDTNLAVPGELHKGKTRNRFKKPDHRDKSKPKPGPGHELGSGSNVEVIEIDRMADDLMTNRRKPGWVLRNGMWVEEEDVELELTLNSAQ
ncbi:LOB domain-containing protein 42, partial [Cucurbita argyrosperma subsp. argyrosperma]